MTSENELIPAETGMTLEQREEMLKDDSIQNLKLVHGIMIAGLTAQGIKAEPGDFVVNGRKIPAGMQGPGVRIGVLADRPRACLFNGNQLLESSWDPKSAVWASIAAKVSGWVKGAKVGAEMLVYLPDYDVVANFYVANKERQTIYGKLLTAMREKKFVQLNSGLKPGKNGLTVFPLVNAIEGEQPLPKFILSEERRAKAFEAFEAYKKEVAAPAAAPRR